MVTKANSNDNNSKIYINYSFLEKTKISGSVHLNTRGMIKIFEDIIGKKEEPVTKNSFFHSERKYKNYYECTPISNSYVDRSINIGNKTIYNNYVDQKPVESEEAQKKRKEKEEDEQRKIIALIAGLALPPLTYVFGRLLGSRKTTNNQMQALEEAKKDWKRAKVDYVTVEGYDETIKKLLKNSKAILDKRLRRNTLQLAGVVSLLGSVVLSIVGYFNKSNALTKAGVVSGGVVIGGSALYHLLTLGFNHGHPSNNKEIESTNKLLEYIDILEERIEVT